MELQALFDTMREDTDRRVWDAGIRIFRAKRVQGVGQDSDELRLHVGVGSGNYEVHLWPDDAEWSCECGNETCAHSVAALLATRESGKKGGELPRAEGMARLRYRIRRDDKDLVLERELIKGPQIRRIDSLHGTGVQLRDEDLEVEDSLRMGNRRIPGAGWRRIFKALVGTDATVWFEDGPIRLSRDPVPPVVLVEDDGDGFVLALRRDKRVDESFRCGVVRIGDSLHPSSDGGLDRTRRQALIRGVRYDPADGGRLVSEILPNLARTLTLRVKTDRLPTAETSRPRLELTLNPGQFGGVETRLDLVYGKPPVARIERGELVLLGGAVPVRDLPAESRLKRQAEELMLPIGRDWMLGEQDAIRFVRDRLPGFAGKVQGKAARWRMRDEPATLRIAGDRLEGDAHPAAVVDAWLGGEPVVRLLDGGWAPIPIEQLEQHGHLIADLVAARGDEDALPTHALPALAALADALNAPPPARLAGLQPLLDGFDGLPEVELPPGLTATLRPYQLLGYRWLRFLQSAGLGGILADDMGLGKTLQALCALVAEGGPSLVVAPTSVVGNWVREAERFFPDVRTSLFHGSKRVLDEDADIIVTTYALLRLDPTLDREWSTVVLDEAQAIKTPTSQTAQAAFRVRAKHRISLTGTPIENRLDELWSQLHFAMPGFLGGRKDFADRYARAVEAGDARAATALRARIGPFVLRRRKQEVARDLPLRTDVVLRCPLPQAQRAIYDTVAQAGREEVARMLGEGKALEVLELLLRLRQAACHPQLLPGDRPDVSGKTDVLIEKLHEVVDSGSKALVFSQWTGFLDLIGAALKSEGLDYVRLDGSTRDRDRVVARFQDDDGPPVFLISLRAGGTGLNLTAADYVFHTDPWWNPAVEDQATDRAHRIGQTRPVVSIKLIAEDTVEEGILQLQEHKRALAEAALDSDAAFIKGLQRDDLAALFEGL